MEIQWETSPAKWYMGVSENGVYKSAILQKG